MEKEEIVMITHKGNEVIIVHSYTNKSIVLNVKSGKSEYVSNNDLKIESKK